MAEVDNFNCDRSRERFGEVERRFGAIARLAAITGPGAIGQMTRAAEADRKRIIETAGDAGHPDHTKCLGENVCQLALQSDIAA